MICDLHHAIAIDWKSVVTGGCNVCAENRETFGREQFGLPRLQVKDGLAAGAKEFFCKRQQIRRPRANRHDHGVGGKGRHPEPFGFAQDRLRRGIPLS